MLHKRVFIFRLFFIITISFYMEFVRVVETFPVFFKLSQCAHNPVANKSSPRKPIVAGRKGDYLIRGLWDNLTCKAGAFQKSL